MNFIAMLKAFKNLATYLGMQIGFGTCRSLTPVRVVQVPQPSPRRSHISA